MFNCIFIYILRATPIAASPHHAFRSQPNDLKGRTETNNRPGGIAACSCSKDALEKQISNRRVLYFLDNDSARIALIRGYIPVLSSLDIVMKCARLDAEARSSPWYSRVHTSSNPADEPSRLSKDKLISIFGAAIVRPSCEGLEGWFTDVLE